MSAEEQNGWLSFERMGQQAEMHLPNVSEPLDVIWVSGSAIAVAPRSAAPFRERHQNEANRNNESEATDSNIRNNQNVETLYENNELESTEEEMLDEEGDGEGYDSDTTVALSPYPELTDNPSDVDNAGENPALNGNSVIIIERANVEEDIVQEPDLVSIPENANAGVENPIIRLENPDYEPEAPKSPNPEATTRGASKRSYGDMMSEDEDGQTCPVCLDVWTNAGDHRLSSLGCGHLFGKSCIFRWLTLEKKKYCPQCNKKANVNEIRELYATKLTALDSSEKVRLEKEIEEIREQKKKVELELMRSNLNVEMYKKQLDSLKLKLANLESNSKGERKISSKSDLPLVKAIKFHLEKTVEIQEGSCRVCAYSGCTNSLIVSHLTRNPLFPGFGVKKIKKIGTDYYGSNFLHLHTKALRDLSFHPTNPNLIVSVSLDKTAKLSDIEEFRVVQTFKANNQLWSCCWDTDDPNIFYAGTVNGCIFVFDIRLLEPITVLNSTDDFGAVVSLRYAPSKPPFKGGILCCRLNAVLLYEKISSTEFAPTHLSDLQGPFISLSYNPETQHILASCRPSTEKPKVRHVYCELSGTTCREIYSFNGGTRQTFLSRSCFVNVNNETLVAAFQENTNTIELWSTSTGSKTQSIPVNEQILDLTSIKIGSKYFLGTVSDSLVRFYEAPSV